MRLGLNYSMHSLTLLAPEHFVTIEDTIPMISNVVSICNETFSKTNRMMSGITSDDSQIPNSRLIKDSNTQDDYILSIKDLHSLDRKILWLLTEQPGSTYSFKALERKLSVHQQSLARSLRRLVELDFIAKSPVGYSLNQMTASSILSLIENSTVNLFGEEDSALEETRKSKKQRKFNQLLQMYIPVKINVEQLVNRISRKWLGNLRWLGLVRKDTGYRLEWMVRDRYSDGNLFRINVTIVSEYIIVESDAETKNEKIEAMSYSNKLIGEILKEFKKDLAENPDIKETYHQVFNDDIKYRVKKEK